MKPGLRTNTYIHLNQVCVELVVVLYIKSSRSCVKLWLGDEETPDHQENTNAPIPQDKQNKKRTQTRKGEPSMRKQGSETPKKQQWFLTNKIN
jgi:hypothetical protein